MILHFFNFSCPSFVQNLLKSVVFSLLFCIIRTRAQSQHSAVPDTAGKHAQEREVLFMKKMLPVFTAIAFSILTLAGCSEAKPAPETTAAETVAETDAQTSTSDTEADTSNGSSDPAKDSDKEKTAVSVGALKGPTSMGLVSMMNSESSVNQYTFSMVTAADELVASVATGKTDIALVPANVASVLYNKTEGGVAAIDINTLGVLYVVSDDASIQSVADLKGKTVYLTGKGTTPDYVARYLFRENGLSEEDVTLEYKSEAAEVAAILKEKTGAVGLLPQPFVTVALTQNPDLGIVLDLTEEWDKVQGTDGSRLVTGVTIVRKDFLAENTEAVDAFLLEHKASTEAVYEDPDAAAELIVQAGIIEKPEIAKKALPYCNITYIDGQEMKNALSGYLSVLAEQDPSSVGGSLPGDDFYYEASAGPQS